MVKETFLSTALLLAMAAPAIAAEDMTPIDASANATKWSCVCVCN